MEIREATNHTGDLIIGDLKLKVTILKDETPVIGYGSAEKYFGLANQKGTFFPRLSGEFKETIGEPFQWQVAGQKRVYKGFDATVLYKFAELIARSKCEEKYLSPVKQQIVQRCWELIGAFANTGIRGTCYDVAGFLAGARQGILATYLNSFICDIFRPWSKRFDYEIWSGFLRVYGKEIPLDRPIHEGAWLSKILSVYVYGVMPKQVIDEIRSRNPYVNGRFRAQKNHQWLSDDIGDPTLMAILAQIRVLLRICPPNSPEKFKRLHRKAFPKNKYEIDMGLGLDV